MKMEKVRGGGGERGGICTKFTLNGSYCENEKKKVGGGMVGEDRSGGGSSGCVD